ncbi:hypothetical protein AQJ67_37470 [Streptomyces caeruleatus]|uniref:Uncharacterized protein n=1 Tax=Streptomyces caeruleatus TaxID=661399 RepID=A0A101TKL2_9ACTN|nr:hypothetical protein AQJ67_37470 [Streptomyces caeruleatus]
MPLAEGFSPAVRPSSSTLSTQALRVEGIEKLCMGAPIRTTSACSSSSMSASRTANAADCSGVRSAGAA